MSQWPDAGTPSDGEGLVRLDTQVVARFLELYPDLPLQVVLSAVREAEATLPTPRPDRHAILTRLISSTLDAYHSP